MCFIDSDLSERLSLIIPPNSIGHWTEESQGRSHRNLLRSDRASEFGRIPKVLNLLSLGEGLGKNRRILLINFH